LELEATELQKGIDSKNPALVKHAAKDRMFINNYGINWLCSSCLYEKQCREMRAEAGEFKEQVRIATSIKQSTPPVKQSLCINPRNSSNFLCNACLASQRGKFTLN
jgi:hypothetical protein